MYRIKEIKVKLKEELEMCFENNEDIECGKTSTTEVELEYKDLVLVVYVKIGEKAKASFFEKVADKWVMKEKLSLKELYAQTSIVDYANEVVSKIVENCESVLEDIEDSCSGNYGGYDSFLEAQTAFYLA